MLRRIIFKRNTGVNVLVKDNIDLMQGYNMQSLKDRASMVSEKKPISKFFSDEETCELSHMNMCIIKKKRQCPRSPYDRTITSKWINKKMTYTEAHMSMPHDSTPLILTGLRLHRNTPSRSCRSSMGTNPASPLTMVRGVSSPSSTVSMYRLSASGCCGSVERKQRQSYLIRWIILKIYTS